MTTFINGSNIVVTNNSEDPDIYLRPSTGKNLIIDGTLQDFDNGVFQTLLVTESTELRNTSDILADQINSLTTTRTSFTLEIPGGNFGRSVAVQKVSPLYLEPYYRRAVTANTLLIGTTVADGYQVFGAVDVLEGEVGPLLDPMVIEPMPMPFVVCQTRRYGESVAIYENDLIMTSTGQGGSDSTALYRFNGVSSEWEFERFFETGEAFACDIRSNTACTDKHIMTKSGATWTLSSIGVGDTVNDCCCTVIAGSRVFFHALDTGTLRVAGSAVTNHSISATSIHVSDGFSFSAGSISRLVCLNGMLLHIYTVSSDGSLTLFQTIDLPEAFDTVRITRSASLIAVVKADKARFCSYFNGSYIFQSNAVSQITIDYPISTSKRAVALTEEKLFVACTLPKCVYEYDLGVSALSVETVISKLTVDSGAIQTSGPSVNITADKVGLCTSNSESNILRYLVVGGGGPGGFSDGTGMTGGGGAGQFIEGTMRLKAKNYIFNVSVGQGAFEQDEILVRGGGSILASTDPDVLSIDAQGGGQGAGVFQDACFGGGGSYKPSDPERSIGTLGPNGFKGGDASPLASIPGGGAGSSGPGSNGTDQFTLPFSGGAGGPGTTSDITGTNVVYAAGGRGANRTHPIIQSTAGVDGADNTGNGGTGGYPAGSGGSGVVIVRFPTVFFQSYTGNCTLSVSGTDTILKFLSGQGSFTLDLPDGVNVLDTLNISGETVAQKKLTTWKNVEILDTTEINGSDATEGALTVVGGVGVGGGLFAGGGVITNRITVTDPGTLMPSGNFLGRTAVENTTASTSTTTGALTVAGGLGVSGTINAQNLTIPGAINYSGRSTGFITGSGAQSIPGNTSTKLSNSYWNGTVSLGGPMEYFDGKFFVKRAGWYIITATVIFSASSAGNERTLLVNRSGFSVGSVLVSSFRASVRCTVDISIVVNATANQDFELFVYQDTGGPLSMNTAFAGYFSIAEL